MQNIEICTAAVPGPLLTLKAEGWGRTELLAPSVSRDVAVPTITVAACMHPTSPRVNALFS